MKPFQEKEILKRIDGTTEPLDQLFPLALQGKDKNRYGRTGNGTSGFAKKA